jgi:hypothetical protein
VAQQEAAHALARSPKVLDRVNTGSDQIAHDLVRRIGNPHGRELAGAMQLGEHNGIVPIGLDPITRTSGNQGRRYDTADVPAARQMTMNAVSAWARLIAEV